MFWPKDSKIAARVPLNGKTLSSNSQYIMYGHYYFISSIESILKSIADKVAVYEYYVLEVRREEILSDRLLGVSCYDFCASNTIKVLLSPN